MDFFDRYRKEKKGVAPMKLCKFCKHVNKGPADAEYNKNLWECRSLANVASGVSPVDGSFTFQMTFCDSLRRSKDHCGPEGKWWEAAPDEREPNA